MLVAEKMMSQTAPYPQILADIVDRTQLEPRWRVYLTDTDFLRDDDHGRGESRGLTLIFTAVVPDTYHPEQTIAINHFFAVPPSTFDEQNWTRWLFDRYCDVRLHEGMEFFQVGGYRPYAPVHKPGFDVYTVREETTDLDRRTQYTGKVDHR